MKTWQFHELWVSNGSVKIKESEEGTVLGADCHHPVIGELNLRTKVLTQTRRILNCWSIKGIIGMSHVQIAGVGSRRQTEQLINCRILNGANRDLTLFAPITKKKKKHGIYITVFLVYVYKILILQSWHQIAKSLLNDHFWQCRAVPSSVVEIPLKDKLPPWYVSFI